MSDEAVQRDLGRMEAQIASLADQVRVLSGEVKTMSEKLSEAEGGWKVLMLIGGASATVGGLVSHFLPTLMKGG